MTYDGKVFNGPAACLQVLRAAWRQVFHEKREEPAVACQDPQWHEMTVDLDTFTAAITDIIKHTQAHKAHGLDGWRALEWRMMDKRSSRQFARVAYLCLQLGQTPAAWKATKVSFLPKTTDAAPPPLGHRPLAILSLAYLTVQ